jgi:hypothetical protein
LTFRLKTTCRDPLSSAQPAVSALIWLLSERPSGVVLCLILCNLKKLCDVDRLQLSARFFHCVIQSHILPEF